jgi:hypothetical protein
VDEAADKSAVPECRPLSGSSSKSRLTCEHLQTPSEIFNDLDWQKQFDGALVRTGVGLDTNSDRKA